MSLYPFERPQKSSLVEVFRVVGVALRKRRYDTHGTCKYYGHSDSFTELDVINQVSKLEHGNNTDEYQECDQQESNSELENANDVDHEDNMENSFETEDDNHFDDVVIIEKSSDSENNNHLEHEDRVEDINESENNNHVDHEVISKENFEPESDNYVNHEDNVDNSEPNLTANEDKLGFLDKAALYNPSTENPATEFENLRLCTVKQVDDAKCFFKAIRLSTVFLLYGLLTAVGDTFFINQAYNMDTSINSLEVPIEVIAYGPSVIRKLVSWLCRWVVDRQVKGKQNRFNGAVRVGLGMLLSVPCFLVAYLVETKRLLAANNDTIISVFWLTPQFFLIGAMDGLAIDGIQDFFEHEMPEAISESYGTFLAEGVVGVGKLLGCLWFVFWYLVTKFHGSTDWFADDIDKSHLNGYYVIMTVFSFICFIIYTAVAAIRYYRHSQVPETSAPS